MWPTVTVLRERDATQWGRIEYKVVQIEPKNWTNQGDFADQISVHFCSNYFSRNVLKSDLRKSRICLISGQI